MDLIHGDLDDVSPYTGIGLYKFVGPSGPNGRISFGIYENEKILWGPETHFSYVAVIREPPWSGWVCFMGTQRPNPFPNEPTDFPAMMACVLKSSVTNPAAYNYWVGPTPCHWLPAIVPAPTEVVCPVATADHLSPISIEKYKGWWRMIYAAIYWNGKEDKERYAIYNGTQYEAVKIWKASNILHWFNNPDDRQVHPLIDLPRNSDIFLFHYAPHWYPPSIYSGPDLMYFNTSIYLFCEGNGEQTWGIRYDAAHYMYWVP